MRALPSSFRRSILVTAHFTFAIILGTTFLCSAAAAQEHPQAVVATPRPLITEALDETRRSVLKGNTHALARRQFDLGTAPASLPMERMLLVLKRSPEQETALRKLLDDQQDKNSPNYHKWLTPEQFGAQFGPGDADMQTITSWLQSHGFQVAPSKGRSVLEFSGSASQVQEAFHTSIHKYVVNAEQHWANASDPSIPAALTGAVAGVMTLHNFTKKPALHFSGEPVPARMVQVPGKVRPQVTFPPQNGQPALNALAPQDYAVIYNITPVYNTAITGIGSSIAVVGRTNLFMGGQDVIDFYNQIGTGNNGFNPPLFNIVLNGADPGDLGGGEEAEATLDSTWSGALAPGATVSLVVSATTNTSDGVDLSEAYIIENNLADIMTESFSACELFATDAQLAGQSALAEQAAAQGITYFVSSGDNGATSCDDPNVAPATNPISVNFLASTAFNVAVGGTMFNENGNTSKYWLSTAPISETAISYIPENVWNESSLSNGLWSSSGGASAGNMQGGGTTPAVTKPYWQTGVTGIPADNVRDVPDVSLTAAGHDPYLLCFEGSCTPDTQGNLFVYFISGTSASAPSFAGVMALIDQGAGRQGLANYILYRLAAQQSAYPSQCNGSGTTAPPATTCIFNDVTVGNNVVPGEVGTSYQAGSGYDLTTGLGSVNVANLQANWSSVNFNPSITTLTLNSGTAVSVTHGTSVPLTITVAPSSTTGTPPTPTGNVVLLTDSSIAPTTMELFPLTTGQVISSTSELPGGTSNVWAHYGGDTTFAPSDSAKTSVTVSAEPSTTTVAALSFDQFGSQLPFTTGAFGSFVYLRADVIGQSGHGRPTGSVTFNDTFAATIPGGSTFTLNNQGSAANPNGIFTFDAGTHTISASYSGDSSFSSSSTTQSQTFTITPGFFATSNSSQPTVTIAAPGGTGSLSITVVNSSGFSGTINLACSGLPSESKCTFSPASINGGGTANTTNVSITITTTAPTASAQLRQTSGPRRWIAAVGLFLPAIFLVGTRRKNIGLLLMMLLLLVLIPACGGGGGGHKPPPDPGTPAGTSNVTVSATGASIVSQTGFTLIVQ